MSLIVYFYWEDDFELVRVRIPAKVIYVLKTSDKSRKYAVFLCAKRFLAWTEFFIFIYFI